MQSLTTLPNIQMPAEEGFLRWLDEEDLTDRVHEVLANLRRYFEHEEIRIEREDDPETLADVLITIVPDRVENADRAYETLTRFDEEWLFDQPLERLGRVGVDLA